MKERHGHKMKYSGSITDIKGIEVGNSTDTET